MLIELAKWTIVAFGLFFIAAGGLMVFKPNTARETLRKAGSTNFLNYAELTLRMIPAAALILYADHSTYPSVLALVGWFMLITSLVLLCVPRRSHHTFSNRCADVLEPFYFQVISPFSVIIGILLIGSVT